MGHCCFFPSQYKLKEEEIYKREVLKDDCMSNVIGNGIYRKETW